MAMDNQVEQGGAESEKARKQDGAGHLEPTYGSESDRGNAEPQGQDAPPVEHVRRTIQGADGPIVIEEESGTAGGDIIAEDEAADSNAGSGTPRSGA